MDYCFSAMCKALHLDIPRSQIRFDPVRRPLQGGRAPVVILSRRLARSSRRPDRRGSKGTPAHLSTWGAAYPAWPASFQATLLIGE